MYVADLSSEGLTDMPGLQFSGIRATRARYPNGGIGGWRKKLFSFSYAFLHFVLLSIASHTHWGV